MTAVRASICLLEVHALVEEQGAQLRTMENTIKVQLKRIMELQRELAEARGEVGD